MESVAEGQADLEPLDVGEVARYVAEHYRRDAHSREVEGAHGAAAGRDAREVGLCSRVEADEAEGLDGASWEDGGGGGGVAAEGAEAGDVGGEEGERARVVAEPEVQERGVVAQDGLRGLADAVQGEAAEVGEAEGREEVRGRGRVGRDGGKEGRHVVGEAEGELERGEVPEGRHEGVGDVLGDEKEERGALDGVCLPSDVEAPDILREVGVRGKRLAAAQGDGGHGGHRVGAFDGGTG